MRTRDFYIIVLVLLGSYFPVQAQQFSVKALHYQQEEYTYAFPLLTDSSVAAQKINYYLWTECLQLPSMHFKNNPFEKSDIPEAGSTQGTTHVSYQIEQNDNKLFIVQINYEYTAAGLHFYHNRYLFDPTSGRLVYISDLFTKSGGEAVLHKLAANRKQRLKNYLKSLDTTANGSTETTVFKTYQQGLQRLNQPSWKVNALHFKNNKLVLIRKSYGYTHYFKALDTAKIYKNVLSYKELQPYLSDYGKCLLSDNATTCPLPIKYQKIQGVFFGELLGKYPIILVSIQSSEFSPEAYLFSKTGAEVIPFRIAPTQGEENIRLWEMDEKGMPGNEELVLYKTSNGGWKGFLRSQNKKQKIEFY